jgi:RimJ/RimL family protein N-acetyltransferase
MIETARLRLRPPAFADAEAIFAEYAQDPAVTRYLSWRTHRQADTVKALLREALEAQKSGSRYLWVITVKEADRAVGMIEARVRGHRLNLGYVLARRYWGNGYMAEALRPLVDWALGQDEIYRVWASCDVENTASARVLEKIGMQREGILRRWFVHPNIGQAPRDCYSYSLVKDDDSVAV